MPAKRSQAKSAVGIEAWGNALAAPAMSAFLSAPGLALSQRLALEGARFWAERMRACADQVEALSHCDSAAAMVEIQAKFLKQAQQDYVAEGEVVRTILVGAGERDRSAEDNTDR